MLAFVAKIVVTGLGLWMADVMLAGLAFDDPATLVLAAILLAFANAVVRPVLFVLAFPITLITLGIFYFVINGAMVLGVGFLLPGFHVAGLTAAVPTSLVVSLLNWFVQSRDRKKR